MQFSQLSEVKHRVTIGAPLPFNVRNGDGTLLLARGQVVGTHDQMEALFRRGCLVDIAELQTPADRVRLASAEALPGLWNESLNQVRDALLNSSEEGFSTALEASPPTVAVQGCDGVAPAK